MTRERVIVMEGPMPDAETDHSSASRAPAGSVAEVDLGPVEPSPVETQWLSDRATAFYRVVAFLCRAMHEAGLTNATICSVLQGDARAVDMACNSMLYAPTMPVADFEGFPSNPVELIRFVAGTSTARAFAREHVAELGRPQSYEEIEQNQEFRREVQQRQFEQAQAIARLSGTHRPSERIMQRLLAPHTEVNAVLVNERTLADIRRWGRDEIDEQTQRELWQSFENEDGREAAQQVRPLRFGQAELDQQFVQAVDRHWRVLRNWVWDSVMGRCGINPDGEINQATFLVRTIQSELRMLFAPFGVVPRGILGDPPWTRRSFRFTLTILGPQSRDRNGHQLCVSLIYNPGIILVFNNGRFEFADFGQCPSSPLAGRATDVSADLRGRGGSSSHDATHGDPPRRHRALHLDL